MQNRRSTKYYLSFSYLSAVVVFTMTFFPSLKAGTVTSQDSIKNQQDLTFLTFYKQGWVLPTNKFVKGDNLHQRPIDSFRAFSLQLIKQTTGDRMWEQLYNYPRYGIGVYSARFINSDELGNPFAIYATFGVPLKIWEKFSLYSELGAGLTFNWKSNKENKYNIALGSETTMYADASLYLEYRSANGVLIDLGLSVSHFSNGALKLPNLGLNEVAPKISLGYNFIKKNKEFEKQVIPKYSPKNEFNISFFNGWENKLYYGSDVDSVTLQKGVYYPAFGFAVLFNRQISYKSKFGIGLMADYMASANTTITVNNGKLEPNNTPLSDGLQVSIFPSYELVINRLSVLMQPGFYIYRIEYPFRLPNSYQRIGLKLNVSKSIFLGINIRAHRFSIADYIEWTVGYRLHS